MDAEKKINSLKKTFVKFIVISSFIILIYSIFRSFEIVRIFLPDNNFKTKLTRKIENKCTSQDFKNETCEINLKKCFNFDFDFIFIMKGPKSKFYINRDLNIIASHTKMIHEDQVAVFFIKNNKIIYRSDNENFLDELQFSNFRFGGWNMKITPDNLNYKVKKKWSSELKKYIYTLYQ